MMARQMVLTEITPQVLIDGLSDFPRGTQCVGTYVDARSGNIVLHLSHPTFPTVREGLMIENRPFKADAAKIAKAIST